MRNFAQKVMALFNTHSFLSCLRTPFVSCRYMMKHHPSPAVPSNQSDKIRNIGIIAHIDAGKTTLTEQVLFLTGTIPTIGEVDDGSTVTDFMEIERERGITIQSAAVSSNWRNHRINLIDTPGHVDFTMEVERSLRVLDGSVTVLDSSSGVQAQTLTVWRQALKFGLPSVFFVNKMDKPNANFDHSLSSVEDRLNSKVLPIVVPVFGNDKLEGFVNVLSQKYLEFNRRPRHYEFVAKDENGSWSDIPKNSRWEEVYSASMEELLIRMADVDEAFEKEFGSNSPALSPLRMREMIRRNTLERRLFPLVCGSALHCSASVLPLLDSVVDFLPSPREREYPIPDETEDCAFVFKVRHDKKRGQLNYARVYRGKIQRGQSSQALVNANTGEHQTNLQLFAPFSDLLMPIDSVEEGNIVVITGLNNTKTGDTLVNCTHIKHNVTRTEHIDFEALAPPTGRNFYKNIAHLALEAVEDPSIRVIEDEEAGQTILEGMGELHIEVMRERLLREYGMNAFFGPLRVNYKEIPQRRADSSELMENVLDKKQWCSLKLEVEPIQSSKTEALIHQFSFYPIGHGERRTGEPGTAFADTPPGLALGEANLAVYEPMMLIEVVLMSNTSEMPHPENVVKSLTEKRATILAISMDGGKGRVVTVQANIPLAETQGLSRTLRTVSSGMASFYLQPNGYQPTGNEFVRGN
uniref:Tr-type G domain-containing protein n=1 Tax=Globodera pallida TaxID=36090 RepID=A0A183BK35_GLOPA